MVLSDFEFENDEIKLNPTAPTASSRILTDYYPARHRYTGDKNTKINKEGERICPDAKIEIISSQKMWNEGKVAYQIKDCQSMRDLVAYIRETYPDSIGMNIHNDFFAAGDKHNPLCVVVLANEQRCQIADNQPLTLYYWSFKKANQTHKGPDRFNQKDD